MNASFTNQRMGLSQTPDDIPQEITVTKGTGEAKSVTNIQGASWTQIQVKVTQTGNEKKELTDQNGFVAAIVKWLGEKKGKHAKNDGVEPSEVDNMSGSSNDALVPAAKKAKTDGNITLSREELEK